MRDYSKGPYDLKEMAIVLNAICNAIGEPCDINPEGDITAILLSTFISKTIAKYGVRTEPTSDNGHVGIALQQLIDSLISNNVINQDKLTNSVHQELHKLKPHPLFDYFTGELKIKI